MTSKVCIICLCIKVFIEKIGFYLEEMLSESPFLLTIDERRFIEYKAIIQ
jgi:hypothetical protein